MGTGVFVFATARVGCAVREGRGRVGDACTVTGVSVGGATVRGTVVAVGEIVVEVGVGVSVCSSAAEDTAVVVSGCCSCVAGVASCGRDVAVT